MIGVTVLLTATVGAFVLDTQRDLADPSPSASFSFDREADGTVRVVYEAGDTLSAGNVTLIGPEDARVTNGFGTTRITATDTATVTGLSAGDQIRVVWTGDDGSKSITLATHTVRSAE